MARLFNAYVIVDWSAASKPNTGADSVWIGVLKRDVRFRLAFEAYNPATRAEAEKRIVAVLDDLKKRSERALLGFDFPLGFPRGFAAALKLPGRARLARGLGPDRQDGQGQGRQHQQPLRRRLRDQPAADRRAVPVLGLPPKDALTTLQPKRAREHGPGDLPEFRHADLAAKGASSIWKLYYNGSVGGQAILGIPVVRRLKLARGEAFKVWPFETGFEALTRPTSPASRWWRPRSIRR